MTTQRSFILGAPALGLLTIVAVVALIGLDLAGTLHGLFSPQPDTQVVRAVFATTQSLAKGSVVRIDGVDQGRVGTLHGDPRQAQTIVELKVDKRALPLYRDASAALKVKTLLGGQGTFYVDLSRGTPSAGPLSGPIAITRTSSQVELDDVTSVFTGRTTTGLQRLPGALADGLADTHAPAQALGAAAAAGPSLRAGLHAVRGEETDTDVSRLLRTGEHTVRALDTPPSLTALVRGAAATLQTTGAHAPQLGDAIGISPAAMSSTRQTMIALRGTLRLADPLIDRLQKAAPRVAPALGELRPTAVAADRLLTGAQPLLRDLRPTSTSLAQTARIGVPLVDALRPDVARLDKTVLPYLGKIDPETQHSTAEMIGPTLAGLGSGAAAQADANGHFFRFPVQAGSAPLYLPCDIYANDPTQHGQLVECQSLQDAIKTLSNYQPGQPTPGTGAGSGGTP